MSNREMAEVEVVEGERFSAKKALSLFVAAVLVCASMMFPATSALAETGQADSASQATGLEAAQVQDGGDENALSAQADSSADFTMLKEVVYYNADNSVNKDLGSLDYVYQVASNGSNGDFYDECGQADLQLILARLSMGNQINSINGVTYGANPADNVAESDYFKTDNWGSGKYWYVMMKKPIPSGTTLPIYVHFTDNSYLRINATSTTLPATEGSVVKGGTVDDFSSPLPFTDYKVLVNKVNNNNACFLDGTTEIPFGDGAQVSGSHGTFKFESHDVIDVGLAYTHKKLNDTGVWYYPNSPSGTWENASTYTPNDSVTLLFKNAVVDRGNVEHDLKVTLTVNQLVTFVSPRNGHKPKCAFIWRDYTVYSHIFSDDCNEANGRTDPAVLHDYEGGMEIQVKQEVVGAHQGESIPFAVTDLDQDYTIGKARFYWGADLGDFNQYEEQVRFQSGALTPAYIPETSVLYYKNLGDQNTLTANGLAFFGTKNDPNHTFNSGLAALLSAQQANLIWRGCRCGTELYSGSVELDYKPTYKPLNFGADGSYGGVSTTASDGDKGGTIRLTNTDGRGHNAEWSASDADRYYCTAGKLATLDEITPNAGWRLANVTSTTGNTSSDGVATELTVQDSAVSGAVKSPVTFIAANYEPIVADVTVSKESGSTGEKLAGAEFTLTGNCEVAGYERAITLTAVSGANGDAVFKDVPYGTYTVKETKAPAGYKINEAFSEQVIIRGEGSDVRSFVCKDEPFKVTHEFVSGTPGKELPPATTEKTPTPKTPQSSSSKASLPTTGDTLLDIALAATFLSAIAVIAIALLARRSRKQQ